MPVHDREGPSMQHVCVPGWHVAPPHEMPVPTTTPPSDTVDASLPESAEAPPSPPEICPPHASAQDDTTTAKSDRRMPARYHATARAANLATRRARLDYRGRVRRLALLALVAACACAPSRPAADARDPYARHERASKKTLEIAALTLATGVTASAFGGGLMGAGKAVGPPNGEPPFWIGVGTLIVGITATTIGLVVLAVSGIQYAAGD